MFVSLAPITKQEHLAAQLVNINVIYEIYYVYIYEHAEDLKKLVMFNPPLFFC